MKKIIYLSAFICSAFAALPSQAQTLPNILTTGSCTPITGVEESYSSFRFSSAHYSTGETTDTRTGLIWKRCPVGYKLDLVGASLQCTFQTGQDRLFNINEALKHYKDNLNNNGWRIPTIKELGSLVSDRCANRLFDPTTFLQGGITTMNVVSSSIMPIQFYPDTNESGTYGYILGHDKSRKRVSTSSNSDNDKGVIYLVKDPD